MNEENEFAHGVVSMARNTIPAVTLVRQGKWSLDDMERWLKAVIENDTRFINTVDFKFLKDIAVAS